MSDETNIKGPQISTITYSLVCITLVIAALIYFAEIFKPIVLAAMFWFIVKALKQSFPGLKSVEKKCQDRLLIHWLC